jgi:hypothetical protein
MGDAATPPNELKTPPMPPYVVRQGDYLAKLAHQFGFDADDVWNDPANGALRELRKTPDVLYPGDVLQLPVAKPESQSLVGGSGNAYAASIPCVEVILVLRDDTGNLLPSEPCEIEGCGPPDGPAPPPTSSDGDGKITLAVPVTQREVTIHLPRKNVTLQVLVGDLDPIEETSGVQKRLQNLGYGDWSEADEEDETLAGATRAFQKDAGLEPTGTLDDELRQALLRRHGT